MLKRTKNLHCLPNDIETKKTLQIVHLTQVTVEGVGGQDGKWSHFPPFFFNPSFTKQGLKQDIV